MYSFGEKKEKRGVRIPEGNTHIHTRADGECHYALGATSITLSLHDQRITGPLFVKMLHDERAFQFSYIDNKRIYSVFLI